MGDQPTVSGNQLNGNMDPEPRNVNTYPIQANFTRGEKCLFAHFVATFTILAILLVAYLVHLCVVEHGTMYKAGRAGAEETKYRSIGFVYVLPHSYMCNSLILSTRWSLAPAHCVAARSDPDLAYALPDWRIALGKRSQRSDATVTDLHVESIIKRSVPHPHFNRDDFQNNIGLFEHNFQDLFTISAPDSLKLKTDDNFIQKMNNFNVELTDTENLELIGWKNHLESSVSVHLVQPLKMQSCKLYTSPIVELRAYEVCVALKEKQNVSIMPGAILVMRSSYVGLFSWGDSRAQGTPFVVLKLADYRNWIQHVITL